MKYIRIFIFALFLGPSALWAATNEFMVAAQLLAAARNADIAQVQALVNNGADVNFVDSTGLSVVCTALMNNDVRAAQILQMYGADASKCDQQIKKYNSRNKEKRSGGLFSGLSSTHNLTLAAAGAAVVVGGLLLFTDVFDAGNGNDSGSGGGDRPNGGGDGGNTGGNATAKLTLPYGPAMPNAESEAANYTNNLNLYSPTTDGILKDNFALMTNDYTQNYLLMMHGYSALARGYMGMRTLRNLITRAPISLTGNNLGPDPVMGGRPATVALVTANGVNATADSSLGDRLLLWTTTNDNGTAANGASNSMLSSKYYNNEIIYGPDTKTIEDDTTVEDKLLVGEFDLSGSGTAINNSSATNLDNMLGKVVGGKDTGYTNADFIGFMPNGQMGVFRTGGGVGFKKVSGASPSGEYTMAGQKLATGDKITLFGRQMTVTMTGENTFDAVPDMGGTAYKGYIGANGNMYITSTAGGAIDQSYSMADGKLTLVGQYGDIDYYNYKALLTAGLLSRNDLEGGRSRMFVLANSSVISPLHARTTEMIDSILANNTQDNFISLVNKYYDRDQTDGTGGANALPGTDAAAFFGNLGSTFSPLVVFSTGASEQTTGNLYADATQVATFENAAPLVFPNLEHLFMSVVAVGMGGTGTKGTTSVSGYSPTNKFALSQWRNDNGTPDDTSDDKYYKSRVCGIAGRGANGIDPWCFAAAGVTDELAVASAAGAAGAVKSAFDYLDNRQLFTLLALTSDGPFLATNTDGAILTRDALRAYLQTMYQLPPEYQYRVEKGGEEYLDVFKEVFGYGLINLERATKPGTKIYYYDANNEKIVSASGNAYWRAATNTQFRASNAFSPRASTISAPFFDVLESSDGELRMPRIWENEFSLGANKRRGLYMEDVFADLKTRNADTPDIEIGSLRFSMSRTDRPYADNMAGLDNMRISFAHGNWNVGAEYQNKFTDGRRAFSGNANPVLALASNTVSADARYTSGRWSFASRAFSGAITDNELLENDPTVSAQYTPARLGLVHGGEVSGGWTGGKTSIVTSVGFARETNTVLGAWTDGLLSLGGGDTTYVDMHGKYNVTDDISVTARATFARTTADAAGQYILGITEIDSNSFALGINAGNFEFTLSQPLAVRHGEMRYSHADYDIVEQDNGKFDIVASNMYAAHLGLRPDQREVRMSGAYRHSFGDFTDGAVGFIYRINPNNTDEFGNESIFMLKMSHRLGI